jgi:hypothetical protein
MPPFGMYAIMARNVQTPAADAGVRDRGYKSAARQLMGGTPEAVN